jgi:hypothetical protein
MDEFSVYFYIPVMRATVCSFYVTVGARSMSALKKSAGVFLNPLTCLIRVTESPRD